MPDEDQQPSLEPPKLFGRKKKQRPADVPDGDDTSTAALPVVPEQKREEPGRDEPRRDAPSRFEPTPVPEPEPGPEVVAEPEPAPAPEPRPRASRAPLPEDVRPATEDPPVARTQVTGAPVFADELPEPDQSDQPDEDPDAGAVGNGDRRARSRRVPRGPLLTGYPASALTGVLVGALMVGLTVAALRGCEAIRGTSTCGGPGLLLLVIILVVLVMVGQLLLRAFRVPDPGSTSFLAVGLIAVVALLFLIDVILDWQMIIVIPLVGLATFLLSHWVTTAFVEPSDR